ncbi:hypothetical protein [Roseomonas harenae]|jgi:hypothetical protein|uniref:hypothetical protein n=1 Tax=Muricoccus harenae TaxID=2692566 RepID=UPI0013319752|nr:hypothetical protein [Roseomonas harenae]
MDAAVDLRPDPQTKRDSYLRIERIGRPAAPWVWKIYSADDFFMQQSRLGYRCAEDALKVGEVFLRRARSGKYLASA